MAKTPNQALHLTRPPERGRAGELGRSAAETRMLVGAVADTFEIQGRGLVVATDTPYERLPRDLKLRIGDPVELRGGGRVFRSRVVGIEHCDPWTPKQLFAFLLPREVVKADVPIGAEVWAVEADAEPVAAVDRGPKAGRGR